MYDEETEDKLLDPLVTLVLQNDADRVIAQIETGDFDPKVLEDVGCCDHPLPLYKLSVCSYIYLALPEWVERMQPLIDRNLEGCRRLLDYWASKGYPVHEPMDFENYAPYCAPYGDCDYEDFFDVELDDLVAMGYDRNEAEMCYAVLSYKPDLIEKHLCLRTNPNVYISGECSPLGADMDNGYCAYRDTCLTISEANGLHGYHCFWERDWFAVAYARDARVLLRMAAYCELVIKLEQVMKSRSED